LNKTGTTTLGVCGRMLGMRTTSCDRALLKDVVLRNDLSGLYEKAESYDLFEDWPYPLVYKELDEAFPGSKFILTVRKSEQAWLSSLSKHSLRTHPLWHSRVFVYGHRYPFGFEEEYLNVYRRHNELVRSYFADRPDDFIELCWEAGDSWEKLCSFLGCPAPEVPFPHANSASNSKPNALITGSNRLLALLARVTRQ
jgi:hypothetical protein